MALLISVVALASLQGAISAEISVLNAGDVVRITVYGQQDLTTVTRIAEDGGITFPFVGDVTIGGLSTGDAEKVIAGLLADGGFVKNAQVNIFLEERSQTFSHSVTILGEVERSGRYTLKAASADGVDTLIDLLAIAGGVNASAADFLLVLRDDGNGKTTLKVDLVELLAEGDMMNNHQMVTGDIVVVPQMQVFYIYGQVQRPGRYRLEKEMTVMQAVAVASGISDRGNENEITLRRRNAEGINTFKAKLTDELQANDVIYVKESFF